MRKQANKGGKLYLLLVFLGLGHQRGNNFYFAQIFERPRGVRQL